MVALKSEAEVKIMAEAGKRLGIILDELSRLVRPGITTQSLEDFSLRRIKESGAEPAFLNYQPAGADRPYPASLCVSINSEVVHTPPSSYVIQNGDVVKLDLGLRLQGWCVDSALTVVVGEASNQIKKLIGTTETALEAAINEAQPGKRLGDIGAVVQGIVESAGLSIVKTLTGHGIGREVHEDPHVFNYGKKGSGQEIVPGMVLALEPITTLGKGDITQREDDAYVTADGSLAAHFEHTVAITKQGPVVLTKRPSAL
ncbi:MAG: type I methionyl aminopeptidase [Anaplasmataceae bacterium]|nr:type I methionyl aminopeptidase [Anaplasmataceae bacterium]